MNKQDLELLLIKIRLWTGLAMIGLIAIQILTGYALAGKLSFGWIDYLLIFKLHSQFSIIFIYFVLTHITVNLRFLFRRWWPEREKILVPVLVRLYIILILATLYVQFF